MINRQTLKIVLRPVCVILGRFVVGSRAAPDCECATQFRFESVLTRDNENFPTSGLAGFEPAFCGSRVCESRHNYWITGINTLNSSIFLFSGSLLHYPSHLSFFFFFTTWPQPNFAKSVISSKSQPGVKSRSLAFRCHFARIEFSHMSHQLPCKIRLHFMVHVITTRPWPDTPFTFSVVVQYIC